MQILQNHANACRKAKRKSQQRRKQNHANARRKRNPDVLVHEAPSLDTPSEIEELRGYMGNNMGNNMDDHVLDAPVAKSELTKSTVASVGDEIGIGVHYALLVDDLS